MCQASQTCRTGLGNKFKGGTGGWKGQTSFRRIWIMYVWGNTMTSAEKPHMTFQSLTQTTWHLKWLLKTFSVACFGKNTSKMTSPHKDPNLFQPSVDPRWFCPKSYAWANNLQTTWLLLAMHAKLPTNSNICWFPRATPPSKHHDTSEIHIRHSRVTITRSNTDPCVKPSHIQVEPHEAVAEVSKKRKPIGKIRGCESELSAQKHRQMSNSLTDYVANWLVDQLTN